MPFYVPSRTVILSGGDELWIGPVIIWNAFQNRAR